MNEIKFFLSQHYEFRINLLRQQTEFRPLDATDFAPLDELSLNTIYVEILSQDIACNYKQLQCLLYSRQQQTYHPVRDYILHLPAWDGRDRITPLAQRVSREELWVDTFRIWMRAMAAQWFGHPMQAANSMVPVLVSERQGLRKSTFCRMLVPPELQNYYLDKLDFTVVGEYDRMLAQNCLINLDEMDRYSPRAMSRFKAATQMQSVLGHSTRTTLITNAPRLASFIATTNQVRLLQDRTGSRRFFCVQVPHTISCAPINHAQVYAQLREEVLRGDRTWFTKQEERRIQRHNESFYTLSPVQEMILQHFRTPDKGEATTPLPPRQIYDTLQASHPQLMRTLRPCDLGQHLRSLFAATARHRDGHHYYAVPLSGTT